MGLGIFCIDHLNCCLTAGSGAFCFSEGRILWGSWFGYKVSRYDGRRGTFFFSRKIYKLALALVSGTWSRVFSLRNSLWVVSARASCKFVLPKEMSPFFLLAGENIIEKHISANPVCGTNIRAPELAVKGTPQKELRIP